MFRDDYLRFIIVEWPKFGSLMFKRDWDPIPWALKENEFYQFEIFRGNVVVKANWI